MISSVPVCLRTWRICLAEKCVEDIEIWVEKLPAWRCLWICILLSAQFNNAWFLKAGLGSGTEVWWEQPFLAIVLLFSYHPGLQPGCKSVTCSLWHSYFLGTFCQCQNWYWETCLNMVFKRESEKMPEINVFNGCLMSVLSEQMKDLNISPYICPEFRVKTAWSFHHRKSFPREVTPKFFRVDWT